MAQGRKSRQGFVKQTLCQENNLKVIDFIGIFYSLSKESNAF
jgi:hypothetical protein